MSEPLAAAESILRRATDQLEILSRQMTTVEKQTRELCAVLDQVLDYADRLEIERNTWRFRAEEMEKERDKARRLLIDARKEIGEGCCPECGTIRAIAVMEGDGCWVECPECGHKEETP